MNDLEKEIAKLKAEGKLPEILKIISSYKSGVADSLPDKLYELLKEDCGYLKNATYRYDYIYAEKRVLEIATKLSLGDLCE